jgi:glyoxylase-like metal-dependent hydrolase (beta-lactamase superfamily II)
VDERGTATISQRTAELGIFPIRLPTPYRIGEVNAYLIADDPLTLIDCGPNWVTSLDSLETQIADAGFALADVGLIVLTHQHPDHMGLVEYLSRRTGAQIACFGPLADVAPEWDDYLHENAGFIHDLMMRHGVERDLADALRPAEDFISKMAPSNFVADRRLADADVLQLRDRSLRIYHLPGHSESDIVLHDERAEVIFAGDHLLKSISSNALVALPLEGCDGQRPRPLSVYRRSLRVTGTLPAHIVFGGHGGTVSGHAALIDQRIAAQTERAERFYETLGAGPMTAFEVGTSKWGRTAVTETYLVLSEVLGSLDLLIDAGRVVEEGDGPVARFRRT